MMMNKWRSLFGIGCLMAVLVLFGAGGTSAQTGTTDTTAATALPNAATVVTTVRVLPFADRFDALQVTWTEPAQDATDTDGTAAGVGPAEGPLTGYRIYYSKTMFAAGDLANAMTMDAGVGVAGTITGLDANTPYYVRVAPKNAMGVGTASADVGGEQAMGKTTAAPKPDRVTDVVVMPGDKMLHVSWDMPYAGHASLTITKYMVTYRTSKTDSKAAGSKSMVEVTGTSAVLANLMNGTMYDVYVKATNNVKQTGPDSVKMTGTPMAGAMPTPTPTLPVFGAFALGAGLLAAGRARLRRREQRQLIR